MATCPAWWGASSNSPTCVPRDVRAALLLVLALAGCIAATPPPAPAEAHAFLAADGKLAPAPAPEGKVAAGSFFASWAQGSDYATWTSAPFPRDVLVENLTAHVKLRATGPVTTSARFPDLMAYAGSGGAWMGYGNATLGPALAPNEEKVVDIAIGVPAGGLWIPAGESLGLKLVPVMTQSSANDLEFLVGGETGSALRWVERAAPHRAGPPSQGNVENGETTGSAYAGSAAPASTFQRFDVTLRERPGWLVAWMNVTDAQGIPDVDLFVEDAQGKTVGFSGTPTPHETVRFAPENLPADGRVTLVVASYGSAHATFNLAWKAGPAPTAS